MTKEKITKNSIISAAFKEWSKSCFWECSLHTVSDALGISKTALYRYFKNKEALLSAMEDMFKASITDTIESIRKSIVSESFQRGIKIFFDTYFRFFSKHPYYLNYLVFRHIQNKAFTLDPDSRDLNEHKEIESHLHTVFIRTLPNSLKNHNAYDFKLLYRGIIFFFPLFIANIHPRNFGLSSIHPDKKQDVISLLYTINMRGFGNTNAFSLPNYGAIEEYFYSKEDIFTGEKIFDAVHEVVSSEGLHKASVSKIASHLGMQKSSLYHYFKSKSDLINTLLQRSAEKLNLSIKECIRSCQSPGDRLYCLIIVTASYFYYSRSSIHLFSWLIFNKLIDKEYLKLPSLRTTDRFKIFEEFFHGELLKTYDLDIKIIFSYLNFNILASILSFLKKKNKILTKDQEESEKKGIIQNMRTLYSYFLNGILGGKDETT